MRRTRRGAGLGMLALGLVHFGLAGPPPARAQESWDAVFIAGAKVGHIHTFVEPVKDRGRDLLRVRVDTVLNFKRDNDQVTTKLQYGTIETLDGQVLRLDTRTLASTQEMRAYGDVIDGKMTLILGGGGQRQQVTIPWGPEVRGPYAAEQSLSRSPMKLGESRDLKMFIPDLNKICDIQLTAKRQEAVELGGGVKRPLLRVEQTTLLEGKSRPEFDVTLWVDPSGQVFKSAQDILGGMVTYRTTREGATAPGSLAKFDLILNSVIKVKHPIPKPESTRAIKYRVSVKDDEPAKILPTDRRQSLRPGADRKSALLEVRTAGPRDGSPDPEPADDQFLRPNALVTSEDPKIVELARKAVGNAIDPWDKATRIERWVHQNIRDKNFETAFAPASEVAQTLSGDCTEHGVLTAAMCRAVGIPARVAVGLIYADRLNGFGFHMWNEVYVNHRWVAIDASFDQSSVDAVHI
ncbi:MAG TPA: transglutaminase family protein, partial [Isosphaeraceae bacterium]|nr:transglutaminase family protein [Isosphaeraceae bacterium]